MLPTASTCSSTPLFLCSSAPPSSKHSKQCLVIKEGVSREHRCHVSAAPEHRLSLLLESNDGIVRQWRDGQRFEGIRRTGDIMIIPAGSVGYCHSEACSRGVEVRIPPSLLANVFAGGVETAPHQLATRFDVHDERLRYLILLLHQEAKERATAPNTKADSLMFDSLATALAVQLLRHHSQTKSVVDELNRELGGGLSFQAQHQVLDYIQENLAGEVQLDDMASVVGLSRYHFLRAFKTSMGLTPHQYVVGQRVELAKRLITQNRFSLREIAHLCGFGDQSHLTRQFRRITGVTPKAFGASSAD